MLALIIERVFSFFILLSPLRVVRFGLGILISDLASPGGDFFLGIVGN
jgi:hypothetical protein